MNNTIADYCSHVCFYGEHEKCALKDCECKCHEDYMSFKDRKAREETKDIEDKFRLEHSNATDNLQASDLVDVDPISKDEIVLTREEALGIWVNLKNVWLNRDYNFIETKQALEKIYEKFGKPR